MSATAPAPELTPLEHDLVHILADALVADFLARPPAWAVTAGMVESPSGTDHSADERPAA